MTMLADGGRFGSKVRVRLTPPRLITFAVSVVLVGLALVSYRLHLPTIGRFVDQHWLAMLITGYMVLALGVIVDGL